MKLLCFGLICALLGGCASQEVSIRNEPAENPAAQNEAAAAFAAAAQTSDASPVASAAVPAEEPAPPVTPADAPSMHTYDPWERLNRFTYRFNARFDERVFLPAANLYRRAPSPLRSGVHNFFGNLSEVDSVINYALQGRFKFGVRSLGRFVINSTLGLAGLIDVAKRLKLPGAPTGSSATLATWGMHPGPYLVMPLLGPSTLREGLGFLGDYGTSYAINVADLYRGNLSWGLGTVNAVDERANVDYRYYASGSPFEYEDVRFLYVRKTLIEDEGLKPKHRKKGGKSPAPPNEAEEPAGK